MELNELITNIQDTFKSASAFCGLRDIRSEDEHHLVANLKSTIEISRKEAEIKRNEYNRFIAECRTYEKALGNTLFAWASRRKE